MPKQTFLNLPEEKRERILKRAVEEFAQKGYKQASITRMVEAAEIAKGSFYQYFEDKEDLFLHIVITQIGAIKLGILEQEARRLKELNLSEFLRHVFKAQIRAFNARPDLYKISMDLTQMAGEPVYEKLVQNYQDVIPTYFEPAIRHEIEQGGIDARVNAQLLNFMLMSMGDYLLFQLTSGTISDSDFSEDFIDKLVDDMDFILSNGIYTS